MRFRRLHVTLGYTGVQIVLRKYNERVERVQGIV